MKAKATLQTWEWCPPLSHCRHQYYARLCHTADIGTMPGSTDSRATERAWLLLDEFVVPPPQKAWRDTNAIYSTGNIYLFKLHMCLESHLLPLCCLFTLFQPSWCVLYLYRCGNAHLPMGWAQSVTYKNKDHYMEILKHNYSVDKKHDLHFLQVQTVNVFFISVLCCTELLPQKTRPNLAYRIHRRSYCVLSEVHLRHFWALSTIGSLTTHL